MKTIILAINDLEFGGGQLTVVNEANILKKSGYNVFVLTFRKSKKNSFEDSLLINSENKVFIDMRSFLDICGFWKLLKFFWRVKPDFVLSNLFFSNTLIRVAKIFYPRVKIIIREGNMPEEKSFMVKVVDFLLYFLTFKIVVNAKVIVNSFKFLPKNKFAVIYNGVDSNFFSCPERIQKEKFIILNAASLQSKKGHIYLLKAVKEIAKKRTDFKILIAGEGYLKKNLIKFVFENSLEEFVEFLNGVGREGLRDIFRKSDIFVLTSLWEGLPNTMLEAMSARLPVISTAVGGVPEVIKDGQNGILIKNTREFKPIAEALLWLMDNNELRERLGDAARKTAEDFTWEKHMENLIALIESR